MKTYEKYFSAKIETQQNHVSKNVSIKYKLLFIFINKLKESE